ncbi:hypothetical protein BDQ17DRAFT_256617 [Cyathus striatus]|nr:hypothetical protein BDQ17DRAFT_256617 [Cyathus striatus]
MAVTVRALTVSRHILLSDSGTLICLLMQKLSPRPTICILSHESEFFFRYGYIIKQLSQSMRVTKFDHNFAVTPMWYLTKGH